MCISDTVNGFLRTEMSSEIEKLELWMVNHTKKKKKN